MKVNQKLSTKYVPQLRQELDSIIEFWYPSAVDQENGGYNINYKIDGTRFKKDSKMIVPQARMVWFFSRLTRWKQNRQYIAAARQGYQFLVEKMRDKENGGYFWKVTNEGMPIKRNKHLYGQAFVMYALAEYVQATNDQAAKRRISELFELIDGVGYDSQFGGYKEYFAPDWEPITKSGTYLDEIEPDWSPQKTTDGEVKPKTKLLNTHLHLMEAFTKAYQVVDSVKLRKRIHELLTICTVTAVRSDVGACTDKYREDWTPDLSKEEYQIISYGHDIESVWLSMQAAKVLDLPSTYYRSLYETIWKYTMKHGYDHKNGGVYFFGPIGETADCRVKAWWVQAEALVSSLKMYEKTMDKKYARIFMDIYDFVREYHVDHEQGEWHSAVMPDGSQKGKKGAEYKCAYHNGRALMQSIDTIQSIVESPS